MLRLLLAIPFILTATIPALAGECGPREDITRALTERYSEAPIWRGISLDGMLMTEIWGNGQAFSIVTTDPTGISCVNVVGGMWQALPPATKGDPA